MDLQQDIASNPTVFGKILRGEISVNKIYEDDKILAFHDIAPEAKVHAMIIPKKRVDCLANVTPEDAELLGYTLTKIPEIAAILGVKDSGFRMIVNSGSDSQGGVDHLHFHILGGQKVGGKLLAVDVVE